MLDDKDIFTSHGFIAIVEQQVEYWFFEWTPYFAFERNKKPHNEVERFIRHYRANIDHELAMRGLIPYACRDPFDWEVCKKHVTRREA